MQSEQFIYKIISLRDWRRMQADGIYDGSIDDLRDGYIHFSTRIQLASTFQKHFQGHRDLVLLEVSIEMLGDALRWEPSRGGDLFPHLYAPLLLKAIMIATPLDEKAGKYLSGLTGEAA